MKKRISFVLAVLAVMTVFCSCSKSTVEPNVNTVQKEDTDNRITELNDGCYNEFGYYNFSGNLIYFYDAQNQNRVVLCNKPNCKHNSDECNAYISSKATNSDDPPSNVNSSAVFIYSTGDRINLLLTDGNMLSIRYDGTDHKIVQTIDSKFTFDKAYKIGQMIYMQAFYSVQENGEIAEKACFITYDTDTNKWQQGQTFNRSLTGDSLLGITDDGFALYYSHEEPAEIPSGTSAEEARKITNSTKCGIYKLNMNTAEKSDIYSGEQGNCYPVTLLNGKLYCYSQNDSTIDSINISNGEFTVVQNNITGDLFFDTPIDNHLVIACTQNSDSDNAYENETVEFLDTDTNHLTNAYTLQSNLDWNNNFRGILGETQDDYIMIYKAEFTVDDSADIPAVSDMKPYIGVISKDDFWNQNYNFTAIDWTIETE